MKTQPSTYQTSTIKLLLFCLAAVLFSSCASYDKVPYFQDLSRSHVTSEDITNLSLPTIQPFDQIAISVTSLNQEASNVFTNNIQVSGTVTTSPAFGYIVDQDGNVNLPLLGTTKVAGLTTAQLSTQLQQQLQTYLGKPTVYVRLVNFKVSVMGDVLRPNVYYSPSERLTITEALTLAGDLNITAHRDDIVLVREVDGKRTYIPINLNKKETFTSPYFYLKPNDLIYVQPGKLKLENADTGYQKASIIISSLTLIAIVVSIFHR
jgi:polysaccharide biosynthesis/export protein